MGIKNSANRGKYPDLFKIFDDYYNGFKENKFLEEPYEALIKTIISDIRRTEKKVRDRRLFTKLMMTIRPFKYLKEDLDFGLFYEREE
jgi:hypothetical protein